MGAAWRVRRRGGDGGMARGDRVTGQGSLEYILILVAVLLGVLGAAGILRSAVKDNAMKNAQSQLEQAGTKVAVK